MTEQQAAQMIELLEQLVDMNAVIANNIAGVLECMQQQEATDNFEESLGSLDD